MSHNITTLRILCLEDALKDAELMEEMLTGAGKNVDMNIAKDEEQFTSFLKTTTYDIILADYTLPGFNASEALKLAKILQPLVPFICISGTIGEDKAVELIKQGATDYVLKDRIGRLVFSVDRALNEVANQEELKMAQNKLRDREIIKIQNDELRRLNATKDKFFSIIAHDLRSPFNSILGFSQMLMDKVHHMDKENIKRMALVINEASKMAVDLLTNLIEWSLSQSGRIEFHPEEISIADVVKKVEPLYGPAARQKDITIKTEIPSQQMAYADEVMLEAILRNLISNAIKFTYTGGEVIISAKEQNNHVVVSVADSGIGISENKMKKLFRIDENVCTEGTNKEKSTGLGLILCKEFVEKHGGRIWVESPSPGNKKPGGSTFSFSLPRNLNPK